MITKQIKDIFLLNIWSYNWLMVNVYCGIYLLKKLECDIKLVIFLRIVI